MIGCWAERSLYLLRAPTAGLKQTPPAYRDISPTANMILIDNLCKSFGSFQALNNITLSIEPGEVFGLLGPNGAGKSTLIRTLMGFLKPDSGYSLIAGLDCHSNRVDVHQSVTYLPGDARVYGLMKGRAILKQFARYRSNASFERALEIADRLELDLTRWVGLMSTGMRQKLALAVCLAVDCPLIILDEPTANLDPTIRGRVLQLIAEAKTAGKTVILSSHVMAEIEEVCDRVAILKRGELVHQQSLESLRKQHRITVGLLEPLPPVPDSLNQQIVVREDKHRYVIETPDRVAEVLQWLSQSHLDDVTVESIGLKAVYDRYHQ